MRQFQSMTRSGEARDFNLIQDNSAYVQNWSIAQALVVMLCTAVQVFTLLYPRYIEMPQWLIPNRAKFSGLLCQELLQGPKRRERGRKRVQNADLINANEQFVAVLNSRGVYFLNTPLCSNRYSNSRCQCVLGKHSVLYMWQIQISRLDAYISITFHTETKQPISSVAHELKWKIVVGIKMSLGLMENQKTTLRYSQMTWQNYSKQTALICPFRIGRHIEGTVKD